MILRRPELKDIRDIEKLAINDDLPYKFLEAAVIEKDDKLIAFGALRTNVEAILYPSGTAREKVESLKVLLQKAEEDAKTHGYKYLEILARDPAFAQILVKHFSFERVSGIPLVKEL